MTVPTVPARRVRGLAGSRLVTIVVTAVVAVAIVAVVYLSDQPAAGVTDVTLLGGTTGSAPRVGEKAPDFSVKLTDGTPVSLSDYQGQPVWLTFGASWCVDCRAEAPDLQSTWESFRGDGLMVLQVNIEEDAKAANDYAERVGLTFPMTADPADVLAGRYHILGIPTHYFIDADGVIAEIRIGGLQLDDMERSVSALLD